MAVSVLTNTGIFMGGYDLSGVLRGVTTPYGAEMLDRTTLADTTRKNFPGLKTASAQVEGLWDASGTDGAPEKPLLFNVGLDEVPFSVVKPRGAGERAFTFLANRATYELGGNVGDLMPFSGSAETSGGVGMVRGMCILDSTGLSSSGNGTKFQVGAVTAGKRMYAALHVTASGTGTFDGVLQSDADSSSGGETNRITFTQATGVTYQWSSVAGAITDTWWRLSYTIAGGAPSFSVALIIGVL